MRGGVAAVVAVAFGAWSAEAHALDPRKALSQYVARAWHQADDGLPQNFVGAIAQTPDGYLWFGTQEGLVRFDGVRFVVFSTANVPELRINDVAALLVDSKGALWIGTRGGGLTRYAGGGFRTWGTAEHLGHDVVVSLHEAKDGAIWAGTRGGGVSRLRGETIETYRVNDGLADDTVWAITETPDDAMWLGTDGGLSRFRDGFTTPGADQGLAHVVVRSLLADGDGTVWIGTGDGGVERLRDGHVTALGEADGLGGGPIYALRRDRDGNLWIGGNRGIGRLSDAVGARGVATSVGTLAWIDRINGERTTEVRSVLEDVEGNLWVGSDANGVSRLKDGRVTTYTASDGLPNETVWSVLEDAAGSIWIGTRGGVARLDGSGKFVPAGSPSDSLASHGDVDTLSLASGGGVWVGTTDHGIERLGPGGPAIWDVAHGLRNASVHVVHEDPTGALWIGTQSNDLFRVRDGKVDSFGNADGYPTSVVNAFADAADGSLWIATDGAGLAHEVNGTFTVLSTRDGLSNDTVQSLYLDGDDLWIGTYGGGLDRLRDGKLGKVTTHEGLFNDVVYSIVDDQAGSLWMTCNKGIFHVPKSELAAVIDGAAARVTSVAMGTLDGMRASECNAGNPGGLRSRDGTLWFPTVRGVVEVDPSERKKNLAPPPVVLEEVDVDRAPIDLARSPEVKAGSRDFTFVYTALSFTTPERVRFKYKLEGYDQDWVDAGTRRAAYYTNLAPRAYHFRVISANEDGVWNEVGANVAFTLRPQFWQTAWFYAACALGLVFTGAFSVRLRLYALRQRALELERKVDERTQQLGKANDDLQGAFKALAEKDARLHEDLLQAQAFQERILPRMPTGGPLRVRALYRPADLVGGDIYDVSEIGDGHFRVFIADTTGHGVQASLRTMVLKTEYDRLKLTAETPARLLEELNRTIARVYPGLEMRCSACCFDVKSNGDGGGAKVLYANAAHPPLLHLSEGKVEEVYSSGTFLGIVDDVTFRQTEVTLEEGDLLVAYTDGICEQENAAGRAFGVERMASLLATTPMDADRALATLDREVLAFAGRPSLDDDVAIVCVECLADRTSTMEVV